MQLILDIVATLCIGLMLGAEFAVSAFINPILGQLDAPAQAHATRLFARKLGTVMPFWYALGLLLLIGEAILRRHQPGALLLGISVGIWAIVVLLSLFLLVPINNRIARSDSSTLSSQLQREHNRWDILHRWRIAILAVAMVLFLIAAHV